VHANIFCKQKINFQLKINLLSYKISWRQRSKIPEIHCFLVWVYLIYNRIDWFCGTKILSTTNSGWLNVLFSDSQPFSARVPQHRKKDNTFPLEQWFSTGVPHNSCVPRKSQRVSPISDFDWYLQVNYNKRCHQIVKKTKEECHESKQVEKRCFRELEDGVLLQISHVNQVRNHC